MMQRIFLISVLISGFFLTSACSNFGALMEKPKVELDSVYIKDTSFIGTTLVFVMDVENPNKKDIKVNELSYTVYISGKELTQSKTEKPIWVPAGESAKVEIPLPIKYASILGELGNVLLAKEVSYKIDGKARLSLFSVPFSKEGKVELR